MEELAKPIPGRHRSLPDPTPGPGQLPVPQVLDAERREAIAGGKREPGDVNAKAGRHECDPQKRRPQRVPGTQPREGRKRAWIEPPSQTHAPPSDRAGVVARAIEVQQQQRNRQQHARITGSCREPAQQSGGPPPPSAGEVDAPYGEGQKQRLGIDGGEEERHRRERDQHHAHVGVVFSQLERHEPVK